MEQLVRDGRLALRHLRQAPVFTLFAVASLALGIGVSTAIYAAIRTLVWLPSGISHADRVAVVTNRGSGNSAMSWADFEDLRRQQTTFHDLAAMRQARVSFATGSTAEMLLGESVSGGYFAALGIVPLRGRLLQPADEIERARVVVLSERFWRSRLAADPAIVGRGVTIAGSAFEVVGVAKGPFHGTQAFLPVDVWVPVRSLPASSSRFAAGEREFTDRGLESYRVLGRMDADLAMSRAAAEMAVAGQGFERAYPTRAIPGRVRPGRAWGARALSDDAGGGRVNAMAGLIVSAVMMVLLIACTNLANLALARASARGQETAVRTALGASRWRLVREALVEGGFVVGMAAVVAALVLRLLVAFFSIDLPVAPGLSIAFQPVVDAHVMTAALAAAALALVVFALWPALQATRADVRGRLGAGRAATVPRWRLHRALVAWQVAGSVALFLAAAMCLTVMGGLARQGSGVDIDRLAVAEVNFDLNGRDETAARPLIDAILANARVRPGVESVSASTGLPFGIRPMPGFVTTPEAPFNATRDAGEHTYVIAASPGLPRTLGLRLARGRGFDARDDAAAPRVAMISEQLAKEIFKTTDAVGRTLQLGYTSRLSDRYPAEWVAVVGVTADTDVWMLGRSGEGLMFVPLAQRFNDPVTFTARGERAPAAAGALREAIRAVDPHLAVSTFGTGDVVLTGPFFLLRIIGWMASLLGLLALVLALAGLFGVLSHVVALRTREIGIRIALGAERSRIFRLILREGTRPVLKGLALGLGVGILARFVVRSLVVTSVVPIAPAAFVVVAVLLVAAGLAACYPPAARAMRVDPNVALREL